MFCLCSFLGFLWYHVLHFSLFKLFWVNSGDLDSVWSTSCSCILVNTPVPLGCLCAASPSPLLGFVGWSLSFSPWPLHMSTPVSCAGECSKAARTICAIWFCLPQVGGCTLPWAFKAPYLSQLISQPVKGAPRVTELFFFHSSHPGAQVLSQFLFFFFLFHPTWLPKWSFLPFWLHEILCQHSVGILRELLHTYMYFWCICGRRWALCPVPPSWSPPASILYKDLMVTWEYRRRKIYQDVHFKCMLYISLSVTVLISLP